MRQLRPRCLFVLDDYSLRQLVIFFIEEIITHHFHIVRFGGGVSHIYHISYLTLTGI